MATTQSYNTNRPKQGSKALWFRPKRLIRLRRQIQGQDEAQGCPGLIGPVRVLYGHEKPRRPLRSRHDADEVEHEPTLSAGEERASGPCGAAEGAEVLDLGQEVVLGVQEQVVGAMGGGVEFG